MKKTIITESMIQDFLVIQSNRGLKEKTIKRFKSNFMAFYHYLKENKKDYIEGVDKLTIEKYLSFLKSKPASKYGRYKNTEGISNKTINEHLITIKHFLQFVSDFYEDGLSPEKIKLLKEKSERMDFFTEEEVKEIVKAVEHTEKYTINQLRLKLLIVMCFVSGLRLSEAQQITVEDIMQGKARIKGKNDKYRTVFFNELCKKLLEDYLKEQEKPLPRIGKVAKNYKEIHYAVMGHHMRDFGTKLCKQTIQLCFERLNEYLKRTKHITLHTMRHSFATNLMRKGVNLSDIQYLMGHAKLQTTATYLHEDRVILQQEQQKAFANFTI